MAAIMSSQAMKPSRESGWSRTMTCERMWSSCRFGSCCAGALTGKKNERVLSGSACNGTSAALGFPIALFNAVGYVLAGQSVDGRPEGSLGYVFLPALAVIACLIPLVTGFLLPAGIRIFTTDPRWCLFC